MKPLNPQDPVPPVGADPVLTWIHSNDETPSVGSGRRLVLVERRPVAKRNPRCIRVRPAHDPKANGDKVTEKVFENIRRRPHG